MPRRKGIQGTRLNFMVNYKRGRMLFLFSTDMMDTFDHLKTSLYLKGGPYTRTPLPFGSATELKCEAIFIVAYAANGINPR